MKKAFTLIELLVVIAIIAILAAILFPVFAQAKLAAKKTTDLSNVKNISMGTMLYLGDSDDVFPLSQYPLSNTGETITWYSAVDPYIKNSNKQNTSIAGMTTSTGSGGIYTATDFPAPKQRNGSYAIHNDAAPDGIFPWSAPGYVPKMMNATSLTMPADKILIVHRGANLGDTGWPTWETNEWNWVDWMGMSDENGTPTNGNIQHHSINKDFSRDCDFPAMGTQSYYDYATSGTHCSRFPRYRYNGSVNVAFFDGHAKSFKRSEKSTSINYARNVFIQGYSNNGGALY